MYLLLATSMLFFIFFSFIILASLFPSCFVLVSSYGRISKHLKWKSITFAMRFVNCRRKLLIYSFRMVFESTVLLWGLYERFPFRIESSSEECNIVFIGWLCHFKSCTQTVFRNHSTHIVVYSSKEQKHFSTLWNICVESTIVFGKRHANKEKEPKCKMAMFFHLIHIEIDLLAMNDVYL